MVSEGVVAFMDGADSVFCLKIDRRMPDGLRITI